MANSKTRLPLMQSIQKSMAIWSFYNQEIMWNSRYFESCADALQSFIDKSSYLQAPTMGVPHQCQCQEFFNFCGVSEACIIPSCSKLTPCTTIWLKSLYRKCRHSCSNFWAHKLQMESHIMDPFDSKSPVPFCLIFSICNEHILC